MSETLVIRLCAAEGAQASWVVVDANGARSGPVQAGPLADALTLAQQRSVVLLLAGSEITLAEPELPLRGGARLAQAVPFALEEQLASEVEGLHFAIGAKAAAAAGTPVAVVARGLMDRWLAACAAAGIEPDAAYSDAETVPATTGGTTLLLDESVVYVRRAGAPPFVLDAEPLPAALALALDASADNAGHVAFYAAPSDYERNREAIEGLRTRNATLQVKLLPDGPLPLLAAQSSFAAGLARWRVPAALAAATALVFLAGQVLAAWQLSKAEKKLDAEIAQVFAQAMPGQKVVDPRAQMQGMLGGGGGRSALLPAVSALAQALTATPQARVESISSRGDVVEFRLVVPSVGSLDAIKQALSAGGLGADLQSATPRGTLTEGRLVIRLGQS